MMPANFFARNPGSMSAVKTLADQVREFIEREGITATELARRCGVSRQNVDNVLNGKVRRVSWIAALADAMSTTTDALLTGKPAAPRLVARGVAELGACSTRAFPCSRGAAQKSLRDAKTFAIVRLTRCPSHSIPEAGSAGRQQMNIEQAAQVVMGTEPTSAVQLEAARAVLFQASRQGYKFGTDNRRGSAAKPFIVITPPATVAEAA